MYISFSASRFIMVYGGSGSAQILDMEDNSKVCNDPENAPRSSVGTNSMNGVSLNGMPVSCEFPGDHVSPSNCHIFKDHTWKLLGTLPAIRHHSAAVTLDDNHFWITGGEVTAGKYTKFWR